MPFVGNIYVHFNQNSVEQLNNDIFYGPAKIFDIYIYIYIYITVGLSPYVRKKECDTGIIYLILT